MPSRFLSTLSQPDRKKLEQTLWDTQSHACFICGKRIDLDLHAGQLDIDHIEPLAVGGKDELGNFALTHSTCNRSKQASNLRVARILSNFNDLREECASLGPNHPNLSDIFQKYGGQKYPLRIKQSDDLIAYSFPELGNNTIFSTPLFYDKLSGMKYFFGNFPIEYLFYDDRINPRGIGGRSFHMLVEEFFKKRPQLHVSLGWAKQKENDNEINIKLFDGQHKAAAQILLGVNYLLVRVFLNPDLDVLLTTNTNAGTTLRQVAFDKSVQRHLGSNLYWERIKRYQISHGKDEDQYDFSEKDLITYFKGEQREIKRYILDEVRDSITHNPENRLRDYIDFGGRQTEKPLSYSSIEKTFYSFFIHDDALQTPLNYNLEIGENPRQLEKIQIMQLMNIIAEELFIGKFDPEVGTNRLEKRIQEGDEKITEDHLRAYRMSREEVLYNWLKTIKNLINRYYLMAGPQIDERKLFQYDFPPSLWESIRKVVRNLGRLSIWKNHELSLSIFGGKQNYDYWQAIFETGKDPTGSQIMPQGVKLDELLKE
jgi:hypothetical protein